MDNLRVLLTFNFAYDTNIFPRERHRIHLHGLYQLLCYTGVRPAELVEAQRKEPKDGSIQVLFDSKVVESADGDEDDKAPDEVSEKIRQLLLQEPIKRGRPKALCYEDIFMMIVRHPVTKRPIPAMAIKFIHHKGADNKPRP